MVRGEEQGRVSPTRIDPSGEGSPDGLFFWGVLFEKPERYRIR